MPNTGITPTSDRPQSLDRETITHDLPNEPGTAVVPVAPAEAPRSMWRDALHRLRRSRMAMVCLVIVAIYAIIGMASLLPVFDQKITQSLNAEQTYQAPTFVLADAKGHKHLAPPAYWFGLDVQGRSVFWGVLYGTRVALLI